MPVVVTAAERASFTRCRRQWDFGAGMRQDLEPVRRAAVPDLDRAVRDALAVYYFPGMWDWDRGVRLPRREVGIHDDGRAGFVAVYATRCDPGGLS